MRILVLLFLSALLSTGPVIGQSFNRPVTSIDVDQNGVYRSGLRYWDGVPRPYTNPAEFAVLGRVSGKGQPTMHFGFTYDTVAVTVAEILVCPEALASSAAQVKHIITSASEGLVFGDSVLVLMTRYEGSFSTPAWYGTNTSLGYKLFQANSDCDDARFLDLIRSGRAWDLLNLSPEELELWRCRASKDLLDAYIQDLVEFEEWRNSLEK